MSSLWTPDGERRIPDPPSPGAPGADGDPPTSSAARAAEDELEELEAQLLATPVEDVIANHSYGLFQLAAMHLSQQPPDFDAARLAIDGLGALVETLGERIGPAEPTLRDGLAQLRLAFVQIAAANTEPDESDRLSPEDEDDAPAAAPADGADDAPA